MEILAVVPDQEETVGQEPDLDGMEILVVVLDLEGIEGQELDQEEIVGQEPGQEVTEIVAAVVLDQEVTVKEIVVQAVLDMDADFFFCTCIDFRKNEIHWQKFPLTPFAEVHLIMKQVYLHVMGFEKNICIK